MTTPIQLPPFSPPLGVFPQFCAPQQTTIVLKEKVWKISGDSFRINDINGALVLVCEGHFSVTDRKTFTDVAGHPLFDLRTRPFHLHKTFEAKGAGGQLLFTVKAKFSIGSTKVSCTFVNTSDGQPVELLVKGDFFHRKATITMNDIPVAEIGRDHFNARQFFGGKQSYFVSIAPGVDVALIAALCICWDEKTAEEEIVIAT
ncbi:MAG: hypothetical protein M1818_007388 [Claussenomyces sp. TS43310]|nr:MAG: hypothetical protein M1818_007388 [Claussenomyces sp. TS43310]